MPTYQVRYQTVRRYLWIADIQAANPEEAVDKLQAKSPGNFYGEVDLTEPIGEEDDLFDAPIEVFNGKTREWIPLRNY